jgi:hypothetical protein
MPRITSPKGMAIINRGCITLLFQALDSLWILEEGGGQNRGSVAVGSEPKSMPRVKLRLAFYLLRAIKRRTDVSLLAYVQSPYRNRACLATTGYAPAAHHWHCEKRAGFKPAPTLRLLRSDRPEQRRRVRLRFRIRFFYFVTFVPPVANRIPSYAPLRFFSSSISCGMILKRSPTTPKSEY